MTSQRFNANILYYAAAHTKAVLQYQNLLPKALNLKTISKNYEQHFPLAFNPIKLSMLLINITG